MRKLLATLLTALMLATTAAYAETPLELTLGTLQTDGQPYSIKNNGTQTVKSVYIECGFYSKGKLVDSVQDYLKNLQPGSTGHGLVPTYIQRDPDRAECRISHTN
jgi:hypothetical protein